MEFSSSLKEGVDTVAKLIEEAGRSILLKGSPSAEEAAKVVSWNIEDRRIYLEIESGKGVRAHDGLLRLRKYLAQSIGLKLKAGLRKVFVESLEVEIPSLRFNVEEARKKLKGVADVEALNGKALIVFRGLSDGDLEDRIVDRALRRILEIKEEEVGAARTLWIRLTQLSG